MSSHDDRGRVEDFPTVVTLQRLVKSFAQTQAVRDVSFDIPAGQVLGLVGENGAGKSTLAKIIAGVHKPDEGVVTVDGEEQSFASPHHAIGAGVSMMAQEILLVPDRTAEENVLLGDLPRRGPFVDKRALRRRYDELVELTGFEIRPTAKVGRLRIADQQKVEIMRALSGNARLIIMDEPSAALTADEVDRLHDSIRRITADGAAVLLVSHFLEEVLELSDTVAIMRDGQLVRCGPTAVETVDTLVAGMVGRSLETHYGEPVTVIDAPPRLEVRGLRIPGRLEDVSFTVGQGEILGLAGLVGAGRTEIARAIFGADPADEGTVLIDGKEVTPSSPKEGLQAGIFMVPEDRKEQGLILNASILDNVLLATLWERSRGGIVSGDGEDDAQQHAARVDLRYSSLNQSVGSLSGGNQQKALFGRAMEVAPRVMLVDEPTRGVDIAAKRAIHALLADMAAEGKAVLFISSDLEEVLGVCGRVLVIHRGRVQQEFTPPYDRDDVLTAFFGQGKLTDD